MRNATMFTVGDASRGRWHEERTKGIGASEAAQAIGVSKYGTPLELYLRKIGELPPIETNRAMRAGHHAEPFVAAEWQAETGKIIEVEQLFLRSTDHPHLFATLDAVTTKGDIVEIKTIGEHRARDAGLGPDGSDAIPTEWLLQAHQQMLVGDSWAGDSPFMIDTSAVHFAVLVGGQELRTYRVERQPRLIESMVYHLSAFWGRVERRDPPPPSAGSDVRFMHLLHPDVEGAIDLDDEFAAEADEWERLGETMRAAEEERNVIKARILRRMGDAAIGHLPDGRVVKRSIQRRPERTQVVRASEWVDMRVTKAKGRAE
jgi:putative phage-type endonuclease